VSEPRHEAVRQMRLVVEAPDYEQAVAFYRDVLGASVELVVHGEGGEKVTILDVGRATLELSNPAQIAMIDQVEVGRPVSPPLRVAFEVSDAEGVTRELVDAGAELVAPATLTPWQSLNARLSAPAGLQLTIFQELEADPNPVVVRPVGRVRSTLSDVDAAPCQADEGAPEAWLEFYPSVRAGLRDVQSGQELILVTWLDQAQRDVLSVHPRGDLSRPLTGVFSTRSPDRPNPIGLHRIEVVEVAPDDGRLRVAHLEAINGTPILDLKPVLTDER
jgi:tRNA-Thr(GGU) m(6)t(6)A37 methyltransferase TsaA